MKVATLVVVVLAFWTALIGYYLHHDLPENIEEPWKVRTFLGIWKALGHISLAANKFGFSGRNFSRAATDYIASFDIPDNDPDLDVKDTQIEGVKVRIYEPRKKQGYGPVIIYFHGGGWTSGSVDTHDPVTRTLARNLTITVISVNYRLAPENPFPEPLNDCFTVTKHLLEFGSQYRVDPSKVVVMGDSAGGNLAAAVAQKHRNVFLQVLIQPVLQVFDFQLPSYIRNDRYSIITSSHNIAHVSLLYMGKHPQLASYFSQNNHTSKLLKTTHSHLVNYRLLPRQFRKDVKRVIVDDGDATVSAEVERFIVDPLFSPLMLKCLKGLPEAYIVVSEFDVLRDEGIIYSRRLELDGVKSTLKIYARGFHGDVAMRHIRSGETTLRDLVKFLRRKLALKKRRIN